MLRLHQNHCPLHSRPCVLCPRGRAPVRFETDRNFKRSRSNIPCQRRLSKMMWEFCPGAQDRYGGSNHISKLWRVCGYWKDCRRPPARREEIARGHFDPGYRTGDLVYKDADRAKRFLSKARRFETTGEMSRWSIVRLENDYAAGTKPGSHTPEAMVADNDLALRSSGIRWRCL